MASVPHEPCDDVANNQQPAIASAKIVADPDVSMQRGSTLRILSPAKCSSIMARSSFGVDALRSCLPQRVAFGRGVALGVHKVGVPDGDQLTGIVPVGTPPD